MTAMVWTGTNIKKVSMNYLGLLVSGNFDQQIGIWDINGCTDEDDNLQALHIFKHHNGAV